MIRRLLSVLRKQATPVSALSPKAETGFFALEAPRDLLFKDEENRRLMRELYCGIDCTQEQFNELILPICLWVASYCQSLPASRFNHHHQAGGLLTHSLEVAVNASRELGGHTFDSVLPGQLRKKRIVQWHAVTTLIALCHDLGKVITEFEVSLPRSKHPELSNTPDSDLIWPAHRKTLVDWLAEFHGTHYKVVWKDSVYRSHEALTSSFIVRVFTESGIDLDYDLYTLATDQTSSEGSSIWAIVKRSDEASASSGLLQGFSEDSSHMLEFRRAMATLLQTGQWRIGSYTMPVRLERDHLHVLVKSGSRDLRRILKRDGRSDRLKFKSDPSVCKALVTLGIAFDGHLDYKLHKYASETEWLVISPAVSKELLEIGHDFEESHPAAPPLPESAREAENAERKGSNYLLKDTRSQLPPRTEVPSTTNTGHVPDPDSYVHVDSYEVSTAETTSITTQDVSSSPVMTEVDMIPKLNTPADEAVDLSTPQADFASTDLCSEVDRRRSSAKANTNQIAQTATSAETSSHTVHTQASHSDVMHPTSSSADDSGTIQSTNSPTNSHMHVLSFLELVDSRLSRPSPGEPIPTEGSVTQHKLGIHVKKSLIKSFLKKTNDHHPSSYLDFLRLLLSYPALLYPEKPSDKSGVYINMAFAKTIFDRTWSLDAPRDVADKNDSGGNASDSSSDFPVRSAYLHNGGQRLSVDQIAPIVADAFNAASVDLDGMLDFFVYVVNHQLRATDPTDYALSEHSSGGVISGHVVASCFKKPLGSGSSRRTYMHLRQFLEDQFLDKEATTGRRKDSDLVILPGLYRILVGCVARCLALEGTSK